MLSMQPGKHKVLMPSVKDHLSMAQPGTVIYLPMQDESFFILGTSLASKSKHYAKYATWKTQSADAKRQGPSVNGMMPHIQGTVWYLLYPMQDVFPSKHYAK